VRSDLKQIRSGGDGQLRPHVLSATPAAQTIQCATSPTFAAQPCSVTPNHTSSAR
jgi:hypothetical protein